MLRLHSWKRQAHSHTGTDVNIFFSSSFRPHRTDREATSSHSMSVGFIGAGQLAHALVKGFTAAGKQDCWVHWLVLSTQIDPGGVDVGAKVHQMQGWISDASVL